MKKGRASVLTIGEEIMIGQILDTNTRFISACLNEIGIDVILKSSVGDKSDEIQAILKYAESKSDIILVTGGLGPTNDDITKNSLSEYFKVPLTLNDQAFHEVKAYFNKRGFDFTETNRQQAYLPSIASVVTNEMGTAPGMRIERDRKIFIVMPGVPHEMQHMMKAKVIPLLKEKFGSMATLNRLIMTAGIGESWLAEKISDWEAGLPPHVSLAYLPGYGQVKLRLSAFGEDYGKLESEINQLVHELKKQIPEYIFSDQGELLEEKIGQILRENKKTLSIAESCTGGHLSHLITSIPGSSDYFTGSVVAYQNEIKKNFLGVREATLQSKGAVSEETVKEMAEGVREQFQTNYSLATSGIAGPGGGTLEKPVGTVWVGLASGDGTLAKKFYFPKDRINNVRFSSSAALILLWQRLQGIHGRNA